MQRPIDASHDVHAAVETAAAVLSERASEIVAEHGITTLVANLPGGTTVEQEVTVDLGPPRPLPDGDPGVQRAIRWVAADRPRLLPRFDGCIEVAATDEGAVLRVEGVYEIPLGAIGAFGDGVAGHRLARRTLDSFVEACGRRLENIATGATVG